MKSCAFAGYNPAEFFFKHNEQHPLCEKLKAALAEQAARLYDCGVRRFYVGGDLGADMWAGEAILALKQQVEYPGIALTCFAPYEGHNGGWADKYNNRLNRLLSCCDETEIAGTIDQYKRRYYGMVERAEVLVVVCRDVYARHSDVGCAVRYATKLGKRIILIHPDTAVVTERSGK